MLVEFPSVVDAVQCAVEVQREMARHNADVPAERRSASGLEEFFPKLTRRNLV
jgi:class 3 adenylate cyclase